MRRCFAQGCRGGARGAIFWAHPTPYWRRWRGRRGRRGRRGCLGLAHIAPAGSGRVCVRARGRRTGGGRRAAGGGVSAAAVALGPLVAVVQWSASIGARRNRYVCPAPWRVRVFLPERSMETGWSAETQAGTEPALAAANARIWRAEDWVSMGKRALAREGTFRTVMLTVSGRTRRRRRTRRTRRTGWTRVVGDCATLHGLPTSIGVALGLRVWRSPSACRGTGETNLFGVNNTLHVHGAARRRTGRGGRSTVPPLRREQTRGPCAAHVQVYNGIRRAHLGSSLALPRRLPPCALLLRAACVRVARRCPGPFCVPHCWHAVRRLPLPSCTATPLASGCGGPSERTSARRTDACYCHAHLLHRWLVPRAALVEGARLEEAQAHTEKPPSARLRATGAGGRRTYLAVPYRRWRARRVVCCVTCESASALL